MEIDNNIAVVTGGASGLGAATAAHLANKGCKVALFDLDQERGEQHASAIGGLFVKVDVSDEDSVNAGLDAVEAWAGTTPRILINCAGIVIGSKTVGKHGAHPLADFVWNSVCFVDMVESVHQAESQCEEELRTVP